MGKAVAEEEAVYPSQTWFEKLVFTKKDIA